MGWLMTDEERKEAISLVVRDYFETGSFLTTPHGSGYWLYGVSYNENVGWLVNELDDGIAMEDKDISDNEAIASWVNGSPLPEGYYSLTFDVARSVVENALKMWGEQWLDTHDLQTLDEAIQFTLLGEIRYG